MPRIAEAAITVILVDDCPIIWDTLDLALTSKPGIRLLGYAQTGVEGLALLARHVPDIAVVDVLMPAMDGFEFATKALAAHPDLRILFFSGVYSHSYIEHARRIRASGWVVKESFEKLASAIKAIMETSSFIAPDSLQIQTIIPVVTFPMVSAGGKGDLTARETEVLRLWTEGFEVKEIAGKLSINARTVESHRAHIIRKTGTRSLAKLTKFALARGIISF